MVGGWAGCAPPPPGPPSPPAPPHPLPTTPGPSPITSSGPGRRVSEKFYKNFVYVIYSGSDFGTRSWKLMLLLTQHKNWLLTVLTVFFFVYFWSLSGCVL